MASSSSSWLRYDCGSRACVRGDAWLYVGLGFWRAVQSSAFGDGAFRPFAGGARTVAAHIFAGIARRRQEQSSMARMRSNAVGRSASRMRPTVHLRPSFSPRRMALCRAGRGCPLHWRRRSICAPCIRATAVNQVACADFRVTESDSHSVLEDGGSEHVGATDPIRSVPDLQVRGDFVCDLMCDTPRYDLSEL